MDLSIETLDNGTQRIYNGDVAIGFTNQNIENSKDIKEENLNFENDKNTTTGDVKNNSSSSNIQTNVASNSNGNNSSSSNTQTNVASNGNGNNSSSSNVQTNVASNSNGNNSSSSNVQTNVASNSDNTKVYKHDESNKLAQYAKEMGMTDDQIDIAVGISRWETGNYKHLAYGYNYGGVTGSGDLGSEGGYAKYSSEEVGMKAYLDNLQRNYFNKGLNTTEQIARKYLGYSDTSSWIAGVNGCKK